MSTALWRPSDAPRAREPRGPLPEAADLARLGITPAGIARLGWLREHYLVVEWSLEIRTIYRLAFLRWLIARGAVSDD